MLGKEGQTFRAGIEPDLPRLDQIDEKIFVVAGVGKHHYALIGQNVRRQFDRIRILGKQRQEKEGRKRQSEYDTQDSLRITYRTRTEKIERTGR
jgi:hypothetical protein